MIVVAGRTPQVLVPEVGHQTGDPDQPEALGEDKDDTQRATRTFTLVKPFALW